MNKRWTQSLSAAVLGTLGLQGCQHACLKPCAPTVAGASPCAACGQAPANSRLHPVAPVPRAGFQTPPGSNVPPPDFRNFEPPLAQAEPPAWRPPASNGIRLSPPEELAPASPKAPVVDESTASPMLPVGISQFASARDQVASGLKPLPDGLDWLKDNGYRTVLYLRAPREDDAKDRRAVEQRGLKYLSLEVSPETLTPKVVEEFNRTVADKANLPLFVYDKDGVLAGGLWYLYFRTVERTAEEAARTRAAQLGLREEANGDHRLMWLAIQKYLSQQGK